MPSGFMHRFIALRPRLGRGTASVSYIRPSLISAPIIRVMLVGLICVNHDVEDFFALSEHLNNLVQAFSLPVGGTYPTTYTENLDDSISGLSSSLIHSTVLNYHVPMEAMHSADKLEVVRILESQGVFATKGSVGQVARELHISEPTVYRYLQKIRNGKV